jgi:hypothetical protein
MALVATTVVLSLTGTGAGCVAVNGGAVELAWTVRRLDASPADCVTQGIVSVSLCVQGCASASPGTVCADEGAPQCPYKVFDCTRLRGATDFAVAPGRKKLWITATCANGAAAEVTVPEPVLRDVSNGDVTELNALLISVPSDHPACAQGGGA